MWSTLDFSDLSTDILQSPIKQQDIPNAMSRAAPSLLRSIPSASRPTLNPLAPINLSRRSIFPAPGSSPRASRPGGNTSSVDPRVLEGLPNFLPKGNVDNVCAWQAGLWERLQAEVRSE